jgi:hypothetical protein
VKEAIDSEGDTLLKLAVMAETRAACIKSEDEAMCDPSDNDTQSDGGRSFVSDSTMLEGEEEVFFRSLRLAIDRLQGLSRSMCSLLPDTAGNMST